MNKNRQNPFAVQVLDSDWLARDQEGLFDMIEGIRATGRLDCETALVSRPGPEKALDWEASLLHCQAADRSRSPLFSDEEVARRRPRRQLAREAQAETLECRRRAKIVREAREREQERAAERRVAETDEFSYLSPVARQVLAEVRGARPGSTLRIDDLARTLMVPHVIIHISIRELVQSGLLIKVPMP